MGLTTLHVGFDDTDSPSGMCTTFLAYRIVHELKENGARFLDFPRLVRLNPNVPWRTRGNGAVAMTVRTENPGAAKERVLGMVERYSDTINGANPGLVFLEGEGIPDLLRRFSEMALWRLVRRGRARDFVRRHGIESYGLGNGQGIVGAISAVGYRFGDCTMELLGYRRRRMFGERRSVSATSVRRMQEEVPSTFGSYDESCGRVLIAPGGPDPVLYGIRGEDPESLLRARGMVDAGEPLAGYMLFRSNQGTGDHMQNRLDPGDMRPYDSGTVSGTVSGDPRTGYGGDVFLEIDSGAGIVHCAVYRETGIAGTARRLIAGDRIEVGGGVRRAARGRPRTLNVEFIRVDGLARDAVQANPPCPECGKRMKSKGRDQGYRCGACGSTALTKVTVERPRSIRAGLHLPVAGSQRHLARPLQRIGRRSSAKFDDTLPWFQRYEE